MKKTINVPLKSGLEWTTKELSYEEVLASFIKAANKMPETIKALQNADEEQWGKLFDEVTHHVMNDEQLKKFVRIEDGILHIGENSWAVRLVVTAFMYGYSIGSACYRAGHCDYTHYV